MGGLFKIKLFSLLGKVRKRTPMGLEFGTIVEPNLTTIEEKRVFTNCFKKGYPPKMQTGLYSQAGRLLETAPRVRAFNNRNNTSDNSSSNYSNNCRNDCSNSCFDRSVCLIRCLKSLFDLDFSNCSSCCTCQSNVTKPMI